MTSPEWLPSVDPDYQRAHSSKRAAYPTLLVQDHLCSQALELAARKTSSRTGFLAILTLDALRLERWHAYSNRKISQVADIQQAQGWQQAAIAGKSQRTPMGLFSPARMDVPVINGNICVLVIGLRGKFIAYSERDMRTVSGIGHELWVELEHAREVHQMEEAYEGAIRAWARAIDARERGNHPDHFDQVSEWAAELGRELGMDEISVGHLRRGAILHDIGKMSIPENILCKPGALTPEEWDHIRRHPLTGAAVVSDIQYLRPSAEVILCHHERWDGAGYPRGLKGKEIPLAARIFSVVDVWDALICDLPYRPAWPRDMALAYIQQQAGRQFDPDIVNAFLKLVSHIPLG